MSKGVFRLDFLIATPDPPFLFEVSWVPTGGCGSGIFMSIRRQGTVEDLNDRLWHRSSIFKPDKFTIKFYGIIWYMRELSVFLNDTTKQSTEFLH